ncbi:MAG: GNAT family N-acetyltransferase [Pseudolysinimonas sp.]
MRTATPADVGLVTETIALAFAADPVWGAALARSDGSTDHHIPFWRLFAEGAIPLGAVHLADDDAAVAVWIPPGEDEMTEEQVDRLGRVVSENLDPVAQEAMLALWDRFEAARPAQPHAYLSILATHPGHRGRGIAQQLVRDDLAQFDRQGLPTHLESTNPANDHRYERLGYAKTGTFAGVGDGVIATMWRDVP